MQGFYSFLMFTEAFKMRKVLTVFLSCNNFNVFFVSNVFYYQLTAFLNFKLLLTPSKHRPINRILKHIISSK